jgi:predicted DCC family thiol-disulfide oxidoreductase YuxK
MTTPAISATADLKEDRAAVFYDGACPLCRREVAMYQGKDNAGTFDWVDVSACEAAVVSPGLTADDAKRRFHVRRADGELLSGAAAFAHLWSSTPGWRWLGRFARLPGMLWILERSYRGFLTVRPQMQRFARSLEKRAR